MSEYCTPRNHVCIGEPTCRKPKADASPKADESESTPKPKAEKPKATTPKE